MRFFVAYVNAGLRGFIVAFPDICTAKEWKKDTIRPGAGFCEVVPAVSLDGEKVYQ
ncbi:MAG: hypothetical protein PVG08_07795 [Desulfobacterales bacterium]